MPNMLLSVHLSFLQVTSGDDCLDWQRGNNVSLSNHPQWLCKAAQTTVRPPWEFCALNVIAIASKTQKHTTLNGNTLDAPRYVYFCASGILLCNWATMTHWLFA